MFHCLQRKVFFFFENTKIWVGRTTLNREKKGDGLKRNENMFIEELHPVINQCH